MRPGLVVLLSFGGGIIGIVAALIIYVSTADLAPLVERYSNTLIGRPIRLGSLNLGLGRTIHIAVRELRLPAAIDSKMPDVAKAGRVDADIRLFPLLTGRLVIQSVSIDNLTVTLARDADGTGNWATSSSSAPKHPSKASRTTLPALLEAKVRNVDISYIGRNGKPFTSHIETLQLRTPGTANPVQVEAEGTMDHVPLTFKAMLNSFNDLQNFSKPFAGKVVLSSGSNSFTYQGTATDPLNLAGLNGKIDLDAPAMSGLANSFGMAVPADLSLSLTGQMKLRSNDWHLSDLHGTLQDAQFGGSADYLDGDPPTLKAAIRFAALDLDSIAGEGGSGAPAGLPTLPAKPALLLDVKLDAKSATYSGITVSDLDTHLLTQPSRATLDQAQFGIAGGRVSASGAAQASSGGTHLTGSATAKGIDVGQVFRANGSSSPPIDGALNAQMQFDLTGSTLPEALGHGRITGAASMAGGTISRKLVRMAKANIRALWTDGGASTPLNCMLAAADIHDGSGTVNPVQVETPIGTLVAWGGVNLVERTVDITLQSQAETTHGLALDVPIHITGALIDPDIKPSTGLFSNASRPDDAGPWPSEIKTLIQSSPCKPG